MPSHNDPLPMTGLVSRRVDPSDRRAFILDLTTEGSEVLAQSRNHRRARLRKALADWPETDLTDMARLLRRFNASMDRLDGQLLLVLGSLLDFVV